jgi:hypothetical protein
MDDQGFIIHVINFILIPLAILVLWILIRKLSDWICKLIVKK